MLVQDFLENSAANHPERIALVCGQQRVTYAQLNAMSDRLATALRHRGLVRGDRVVICLGNTLEAVVSIFAALKADSVFVVLNRATRPDKLQFILDHCQAAALITDQRVVRPTPGRECLEKTKSLKTVVICGDPPVAFTTRDPMRLEFTTLMAKGNAQPIPAQNEEQDLACLIYTSGTTGEPKGVMCEHGSVRFVTESIVSYLSNNPRDVVLNVLPLSSSYGLYQLMASVCASGTLVLEESFAFPAAMLRRMVQEHVTGFAGVPTIYSMLLNLDLNRTDLSALRYFTNAAAALPLEHTRRLRQLLPGVKLFLMHGLTEVARTMFLPPDQVDLRPDSSGQPLHGTQLWLEDESGRRVGPGCVGELVVQGPHVMRGYWNDPSKTRERFRSGPGPGQRICYSGDLFRTDEQGFYYFVSRKDDIIKCRGEKVAPREVENVLYALGGVREAAVVGVADPMFGSVVKAFIAAPGAGLTSRTVIAHCRTRLEDFMVPRYVEFRNELPKTANGKIRKIDLH